MLPSSFTFLLLSLLLAETLAAQTLRELSTDRPDQTESPISVDAGRVQIESGLATWTFDSGQRELSLTAVNVKLGLTRSTDLQMVYDPLVLNSGKTRSGDLLTRFKWNLWGNEGDTRTAFAVMPYLKWPLQRSAVRNGKTEAGIIAILGVELPAGWSVTSMAEVDWVAQDLGGYAEEYFTTITFGHSITEKLAGYVEMAALFTPSQRGNYQGQFDCGLTYALTENCQLDCGCNFGITSTAPDFQPFVGMTVRY